LLFINIIFPQLNNPVTTKEVINDHPNTYTFTKALAEQLLLETAADLPLAIIRPSIVVAAWKDPMPGWVDNLNGPTGTRLCLTFLNNSTII
jgi:fatty acyl-CoA reductase